jgi:hypothetical protein
MRRRIVVEEEAFYSLSPEYRGEGECAVVVLDVLKSVGSSAASGEGQ